MVMDSTNRDIVQKSFLSAAPFLLELRNITKQYPNTKKKANNNINLQIKKGEILCIAGENGAGKSTLMKILMGLEKANAGEILFNGKKQKINSPLDAKNWGLEWYISILCFLKITQQRKILLWEMNRVNGVFF